MSSDKKSIYDRLFDHHKETGKGREGLEPTIYMDPKGNASIGVGHNLNIKGQTDAQRNESV